MRHWNRPAKGPVAAALALAMALALGGCSSRGGDGGASKPEPKPEPSEVVLASTTSTQDSGLFDVLIPAFEKANPGYKVRVVAVGTGQALALGEKKDADVLLVHSKASELEFMAKGFGIERRDVMFNEFILVGPKADPAGLKGMGASEAFKAIAAKGATFVARGDDSGTAKKEASIWASAGVEPKGATWYKSTGQGMGETLQVASETEGYCLTDEATFLAQREQLELVEFVRQDPKLRNQYGVITVEGAENPGGGKAFAGWITSAEGQSVIGGFGKEEFGKALFTPNAE